MNTDKENIETSSSQGMAGHRPDPNKMHKSPSTNADRNIAITLAVILVVAGGVIGYVVFQIKKQERVAGEEYQSNIRQQVNEDISALSKQMSVSKSSLCDAGGPYYSYDGCKSLKDMVR